MSTPSIVLICLLAAALVIGLGLFLRVRSRKKKAAQDIYPLW